ncbi:MAG: STAS domain-containing protein [Terriglobales bacterium]
MLEIRKELVAPDIAVFHFSGRIAMGRACQDIEAQIDELIREKVTKVILDLTDVQRVDSTGFGTIVMSSQKLKNAGGGLRVVGAKGIVEEIAHTSHIPTIVPFHGTLAEAVTAFRPA